MRVKRLFEKMDDCRSKLGVRRWELADRGKTEGESRESIDEGREL
jgi:hypothetical protein